MTAPTSSKSTHILVVGAGVIGLTTAIRLLRSKSHSEQHTVTLLSSHFPTDSKDISYCSAWAGAHHVSTYGVSKEQQEMEMETFEEMWEMSGEEGGDAKDRFMRIHQVDYYVEEKDVKEMNLDKMPNFRMLKEDELVLGTKQGVSFDTVTIDTSQYLPYLFNLFTSLGGRIIRANIQHVSQLIPPLIPGAPVDGVILCVGLGARFLGGVEDKDVYPIRGQTVLVRAPHVNFGRTMASNDGTWTYIIPRSTGDIILGGYKTNNDWTSLPLPSHTTSILTRSLLLCPELVPPESRADVNKPDVEELRKLIVEEGCGLRPARKGGIRLESEVVELGGREVVLVHHYGHGGSGYQSSLGSADRCIKVLHAALATVQQRS